MPGATLTITRAEKIFHITSLILRKLYSIDKQSKLKLACKTILKKNFGKVGVWSWKRRSTSIYSNKLRVRVYSVADPFHFDRDLEGIRIL